MTVNKQIAMNVKREHLLKYLVIFCKPHSIIAIVIFLGKLLYYHKYKIVISNLTLVC